MNRRTSVVALAALLCMIVPRLNAEGEPEKKRHHKVSEWLSILSSDSREKLRNAKQTALKDPAVQAAKVRRDQAEAEYRQLLHREMLRVDPSVKPLLETITELKSHDDL